MQIFDWLKRGNSTTTSKDNIHKRVVVKEESGSDRRRREKGKFGTRKLSAFGFVCRKEVENACFYSILNLRRIDRKEKDHMVIYSMKMKKQEVNVPNETLAAAGHVIGNKVLPITEYSTTLTNEKLITKGDQKIKGMSRMKDLLRWAAAAKTHNHNKAKLPGTKVMQFRNKAAIKAVKENENENEKEEDSSVSESPKISLKWELESNYSICSSMASSSSNLQRVSLCPVRGRKGNWITTDSDFVVLEL